MTQTTLENYISLSDLELIKIYRQGDPIAFRTLHDRYILQLSSFISKYLSNRSHLLDVVSETFRKVVIGIGKLQNPSKFKSWLYQIGKHEALNWTKKQKRFDIILELELDLIDPRSTPEQPVIDADLSMYLSGLIRELPPHQNQALILYYFWGLNYKQVGEGLNVSRTAAYNWVKNGETALKGLLDRKGLTAEILLG